MQNYLIAAVLYAFGVATLCARQAGGAPVMARNGRFGVSWREGEPETARAWRGPISRAFAEVRFFRFDPRNLRRICATWWWDEYEGAPAEIAAQSEERVRRYGR